MKRKGQLQEDICQKLDDIDGLIQALKDARIDLKALIQEYRSIDDKQTSLSSTTTQE